MVKDGDHHHHSSVVEAEALKERPLVLSEDDFNRLLNGNMKKERTCKHNNVNDRDVEEEVLDVHRWLVEHGCVHFSDEHRVEKVCKERELGDGSPEFPGKEIVENLSNGTDAVEGKQDDERKHVVGEGTSDDDGDVNEEVERVNATSRLGVGNGRGTRSLEELIMGDVQLHEGNCYNRNPTDVLKDSALTKVVHCLGRSVEVSHVNSNEHSTDARQSIGVVVKLEERAFRSVKVKLLHGDETTGTHDDTDQTRDKGPLGDRLHAPVVLPEEREKQIELELQSERPRVPNTPPERQHVVHEEEVTNPHEVLA